MTLSEQRFLRLNQIIGDNKKGIAPIIPVSKSSWWSGIKNGRFPKPRKLSARTTVWLASDIEKLISKTMNEPTTAPFATGGIRNQTALGRKKLKK